MKISVWDKLARTGFVAVICGLIVFASTDSSTELAVLGLILCCGGWLMMARGLFIRERGKK